MTNRSNDGFRGIRLGAMLAYPSWGATEVVLLGSALEVIYAHRGNSESKYVELILKDPQNSYGIERRPSRVTAAAVG